MKNNTEYQVTPKTKLNRMPRRGTYNKQEINQILDETFICHIGFTAENQPYVIPICYGRENDTLYFHGAKANRMFRYMKDGASVCLTVSIADGLVLARSAYHHSLNYRSVIVFGKAQEITDPAEKTNALKVIVEHFLPGRWDDVRKPNRQELDGTAVFSIKLDEVSAKVRTGMPTDEPEDMELNIWAGVLPVYTTSAPPEKDPALSDKIPLPEYIKNYKSR